MLRGSGSRPRSVALLAALSGAAMVIAVAVLPGRGEVDLLRRFDRDGLMAAAGKKAKSTGDWTVTSGSLFALEGMLWSGAPDDEMPASDGSSTGSATLRAVSRDTFRNVSVEVDVKLVALTPADGPDSRAWDGVHLFLRYQNPRNLYVLDLARRDGTATIKRKSPGGPSNGGSYRTLTTARLPLTQEWRSFVVTIRDEPEGVRIRVRLNGQVVLGALDGGSEVHEALRAAGRVGIRGDRAEFYVRRFVVRELEPTQG